MLFPHQPCLILGNTTWATPFFMTFIKEHFPFLRDSVIEPLPSCVDDDGDDPLFIFKAGAYGVLALEDWTTLYYLGKDTTEVEKAYEVVKAHGWVFSPYPPLDDKGEMDDSYHRLGLFGGALTKTLSTQPESRTAELIVFQAKIIQFINEQLIEFWPGWKARVRGGVDDMFKKLMGVALEVAFVDVRLCSYGGVFVRWTGNTGGVGKVITT